MSREMEHFFVSTKVAADWHGKLFLGGLSMQTAENTLEAVFGKFGPIVEVRLMKDRKTNLSRGFAFMTFRSPEDAMDAAKVMNGKSLDGKTIKVEEAHNPSFESDGRRRSPLPSRNRSYGRSLRCARGGSRGARRRPSGGEHLGDGGYTLSLNKCSPRGPFPGKRGPSSRSADPPPKRAADSSPRRSHSGMGRPGPVSCRRENYGGAPRKEPISSGRNYYKPPREDDGCTSSRGGRFSRDTKDYGPPTRDYAYRDHGLSGSWDEHSRRRHSGRVGHGGSRDRKYPDYPSRGGHRDPCETYGSSRGAAPARGPPLTHGGSSRSADYYGSRRGGSDGGRENYSSRRRETGFSGRGRGGRRDRGFSASMGWGNSAPHESHTSSGYWVSQ